YKGADAPAGSQAGTGNASSILYILALSLTSPKHISVPPEDFDHLPMETKIGLTSSCPTAESSSSERSPAPAESDLKSNRSLSSICDGAILPNAANIEVQIFGNSVSSSSMSLLTRLRLRFSCDPQRSQGMIGKSCVAA